jgi:peroxiredoxin
MPALISPRMRLPMLALALSIPTFAARADEPPKPTPTNPEAAAATPAPGHSLHGEAFNDGPRQRAVPLKGQGEVRFQVTTKFPEAQAFINQGVGQLHTFYYYEAERSFRQAATLDPDCAMAYWGMAMSNVNNAKRARGFLAKAKEPARYDKAAEREKRYIDGLAEFHAEKSDDKARRKKWADALESIVEDNPDDLDGKAWLAMTLWQNGQKDGFTSRKAIDALITEVLLAAPNHPGAHHYRIHLWDGHKAKLALPSAAAYAGTSPGIAHAWHMPGHTYDNLKRFSDASYQQEGSARVDHAAMTLHRVMPFEIHNYGHNNQWLATSLGHVGRVRDALAVARNLVEQPRDPQKNGPKDGGSPQRNGRKRWSELLVRWELWDDLIRDIESGALDWSDVPEEQIEKHRTLGLAYAAKGDHIRLAEQVAALRDRLEEARKPKKEEPKKEEPKKEEPKKEEPKKEEPKKEEPKKEEPKKEEPKKEEPKKEEPKKEEPKKEEPKKEEPKKEEPKPTAAAQPIAVPAPLKEAAEKVREAARSLKGKGQPQIPPGLEAALAELEGHQHLLAKDTDKALGRFEQAKNMRAEAKARAQLAVGKGKEAEETIAKGVEAGRGQVTPLAAQVEVLNALGKAKEAQEAYRKLAPMLREADPGLPILDRVAAIAAAWPAEAKNAPAPAPEPHAPDRIDLAPLGPLGWEPFDAPALALPDTEGATWDLSQHRGRPVVVLFYLGGKCAHCMQQLQEFGKAYEDFRKLGVDLVAVSTDATEATRELKANDGSVKFPMPLLSDPSLGAFRAWRAHDDFEDDPLHGTFLVGPDGTIRFQRISADPFLDADFLKGEAARILQLYARKPAPAPPASDTPAEDAAEAAGP